MVHTPWAVDAAAPMPADDKNLLAYGDNLDVLRRYVRDESVDLVYLDPPFNSNVDYNILYGTQDGTRAAAQIKAFKDTWRWDRSAVASLEEVVEGGGDVSRAMQALKMMLGSSDMLAYLAMMAPRLVELRRVLKRTGSLYLHCDPNASHYLKVLLDAIFGPEQFRNEIIWKRTAAHSNARRFGRIHDVLLYYGKTEATKWNPTHQPYDPAYVAQYYRYVDERTTRRFMSDNLTAPGRTEGEPREFGSHGTKAPAKGRHWMYDQAKIDELISQDRIFFTRNDVPRLKSFLDEAPGLPLQDVLTDIEALRSWHKEGLGYPTQKPIGLLRRLIEASTDPGDTVLDPFCGCGTAIIAAERLDRRWLGIDITHHAVALIKHRLIVEFGPTVAEGIRIIGEPTTAEDASVLAREDPFQFQAWALGLVGARPINGIKKGADRGIDGQLFFHESEGGATRQILLSVKAGHTGPAHVRDLRGVLDREDGDIGVLISLAESTKAMRTEAADAGFYEFKGKRYAKLQLRTIAELLGGHGIEYPPTTETVFRPTIWPPESIPVVPRRRRKAARRAAAAAAPRPKPEPLPVESEAAAPLREDYARRAAASAAEPSKESEPSPAAPRSRRPSKRGR